MVFMYEFLYKDENNFLVFWMEGDTYRISAEKYNLFDYNIVTPRHYVNNWTGKIEVIGGPFHYNYCIDINGSTYRKASQYDLDKWYKESFPYCQNMRVYDSLQNIYKNSKNDY